MRGSGKKKSAQKLSDIDVVDEQELRVAVSNIETKHEKEIHTLLTSYKSLYPKWVFELRCGFGLLMYGFGSKKALLEDFASTEPGVGLQGSTSKVQKPSSLQSMEDLLAFLDGSYAKENDCFVCVVMHNIDGPGLRDTESQQYLARLASCSNVRVVASIDHVNTALLWDKKMVHTQFNWCWYHVPTFAPYKVEGVFLPLILACSGQPKMLKPLQSSQMTLNSHLTEFKDHELIKTRRHSDGQDCVYIPLTSEAITKLLEEIG
ncbi:hypothetical protein MKW92_008584 [Papaver armeniacum]|nr:hypothetical protein MKW92_008584 [Papaver armeniacum]